MYDTGGLGSMMQQSIGWCRIGWEQITFTLLGSDPISSQRPVEGLDLVSSTKSAPVQSAKS